MTDTPEQQPSGPAPRTRPGWLVPAVVVATLLVVAAVVVGIVVGRGSGDAAPSAPATVRLPSPTPTIAPAEREATTAFASALPGSVLQFALASSAADDDWLAANAVEAYREEYSDGADGALLLQAGQWATAQEAAAFAAGLVDALPTASAPTPSASPGTGLPLSGDVEADGEKVGTFTVVDLGDGTGAAVWTNGATVLRLAGPATVVADAYAAFPL